jgi:membrane protease YdiL (CAAX protease family)
MEMKLSNWRIRDIFYVLVLYFIVFSIFLFIEAKLFGEGVLSNTGMSLNLFFLEDIVDNFILFLLPILFVTKVYEANIKEIGFTLQDLKRNSGLGFIVGISLWIVATALDFVVESIWGVSPIHPYIQQLEESNTLISYFVILISIILLAPISEEVYCRGFAYTIFKRRFGKIAGVILSSLLFAGLHFNVLWFVQIFIIGIGLALLFERTGSLVSVIIAHSISNLLSMYIGNIYGG